MRAWGRVIFTKWVAPVFFCIGAYFMSCVFPVQVMAYENVVIVIDPGHGGEGMKDETDSGARYNGVMEKNVDLITAQALFDELSQYGNLTVHMTRTDDVHMSLQDRVDFAKSVGADILISVHYNASAHHRFYGTEIFTSAYGEEFAKGYSLAQTVMSWWNEDGNVSKGIKTRIGKNGDYYGLIRMGREAGIPTIILEHGYLDNEHDFSRLGDEEAWRHMGILDATAIADYYGAKKGMVQAGVNGELTVPVPAGQMDDVTTPPENVAFTIDSYDKITGVLTYTVSAVEPNERAKLMYFDLDTQDLAADEENGFMHLNVWDAGASSMQGTFKVPDGYRGPFVARVYNNYEKFTDSAPVSIPADMLPADVESVQLGAVGSSDVGLTGAPGSGGESPKVTLQDENGATWSLEDALKNAKSGSFITNPDDPYSNRYYIGMIIAGVVIVAMLVAAIIMAVLSGRKKKRRRMRQRR